jgi:Protein N-terminal asparagine amidohydrolase
MRRSESSRDFDSGSPWHSTEVKLGAVKVDEIVRSSSIYLKDGNNKLERLFLPRRDSCHLDEYLSSIPRVVSRSQELNATEQPHQRQQHQQHGENSNNVPHGNEFLKHDSRRSYGRCLNVLQGEAAYASSEQADYLVSAEATTCHVIALRSTSKNNSVVAPLSSLAHVDSSYDACLEAMIREHLLHHEQKVADIRREEDFGFFMDEMDEEEEVCLEDNEHIASSEASSFLPAQGIAPRPPRRTVSMPMFQRERIEMELHMVGGYKDKDGTSQQLSSSLLERFSELAEKYSECLRISLSTAAISSMNTEGNETTAAPINRGLCIETATGIVFPIRSSLPRHLEGPAVEVRSARIFCSDDTPATLRVIHDRTSRNGEIRIDPFRYLADPRLKVLLDVPDDVLLSVASTSPGQESDQFCSNFRRTLSFATLNSAENVFARGRPLVYTRSANNLNEWVASQQLP